MVPCVTAAALLGGSLYLSLHGGPKEAAAAFVARLPKRTQSIYEAIVSERRSIYHQGLLLGLVLAVVVVHGAFGRKEKSSYKAGFCIGTAITLGVSCIFYLLHPKSAYMTAHLRTAGQRDAWARISRRFRVIYICGLLLGAGAGGLLASSVCPYPKQ